MPTQKVLEDHLIHRKPFKHVYRLKTKEGVYKHFLVRGQAIWDNEGKPVRMAGSLTDISENIKQQRLLLEMSEVAMVGAWEIRQEDQLLAHTDITRRILEIEKDAVITLDDMLSMFKEGSSRAFIEQAFHDAIVYAKDFDLELEMITAKGNLRWVRTKGAAEMLNDRVERIYGIFVDITLRKQTELELKYNEERFRSLFYNITDIITLIDANGAILFQSSSAQQIMHYQENELRGKNIFELIHPADIASLETAFKRLIASGGVSERAEFRFRNKHGNYIYLEAQGNNQLNNPAIGAIIISSREITARKQNELNLQRKTRLLEAVASISSILLEQRPWEEILKEIFPLIGTSTEVDRVYYFEKARHSITGEPCVNQVVEWANNNSDTALYNPALQDLSFSLISDFIGVLQEKRPFVQIVRNMPLTATRLLLQDQGVVSILVLPVFDKDTFIGFIGFDDCSVERNWTNDEISVLQLLANSISTAVVVKKAQQELHLSNQRYEYVSKATSDIIWEMNSHDASISFWGYGVGRLADVSGNFYQSDMEAEFQKIHPENRASIIESYTQFLKSNSQFWEKEFRYRINNGHYVFLRNRAMAIRTIGGELMKVIGVMEDISDQKNREAENELLLQMSSLMRGKQRLKERIEALFALLAKHYQFRYAEFWNTDITSESLILHSRWSEEGKINFAASKETRIYQDVITGPISECWVKGTLMYFPDITVSGLPILDEVNEAGLCSLCCIPVKASGETLGVVSLFWNSTELYAEMGARFIHEFQKFMGERLKQYQLEEQLNSFFNISPAFLIITKQAKFVRVNQLLLQTVGMRETDIVGKDIMAFIHPDDRTAMRKIIVDVNEKRITSRYRTRLMVKHGLIIWLDAISVYNEETDSVFTVGLDVTNEVALQEKLNAERQSRINEVAEAAILAQEREKEDLAKELHDNINQILATSLMYLSLVKVSDVTQKEHLAKAISMVKESIKEIRYLSHTLSAAVLNDHDLHYALLNLFDIIHKSTGVKVNHEVGLLLSESLQHKLKFNIYRIIQEQFNNIHKHARAKNVLIEIYKDGEAIILRIKDDGIGQCVKTMESGIGLINIRSRVNLFNGTMEVNTQPSKGFELITTFVNY
jgi:PAS domain S-box-containing protein